MITVVSYSIYHSPNSYLGAVLVERALAGLPVIIERRPIFIPKTRGVKVADLLGGTETATKGSYRREDCTPWARKHEIELNPLPPGEFEARAARRLSPVSCVASSTNKSTTQQGAPRTSHPLTLSLSRRERAPSCSLSFQSLS